MVMVHDHSESSSDNEGERHDRFRSERVLAQPVRRRSRERRRSRSLSPRRSQGKSSRRHYDDRRSRSPGHRHRDKLKRDSVRRKSLEKRPRRSLDRGSPDRKHKPREENNRKPESGGHRKKEEQTSQDEKNFFGPALPPTKKEEPCIGPMLPPGMKIIDTVEEEPDKDDDMGSDVKQRDSKENEVKEEEFEGPKLPPGFRVVSEEEEEMEEDVIGPQLPCDEKGSSQAHRALEHRATMLKNQMDNKERNMGVTEKREEWMMKPPEMKLWMSGTEPRKFRTKELPKECSGWTETPQDKQRLESTGASDSRLDAEDERRKARIRARDDEMERLAGKSTKRKDKSLLEQHQKTLRKKRKREKKEREGKKKERRPFDRNIDLQANRLDEAQKKSVMKKARLLDTRFSYGESKFL